MQVTVNNRHTGKPKFTTEIHCSDETPIPMRLRRAVEWAIKTGIDLAGADLSGGWFDHLDFKKSRLGDVNLNDALMANADLSGVLLEQATAVGADFTRARLNGATIVRSDFSRAKLRLADFSGAGVGYTNFSGTDLTSAYLGHNRYIHCRFNEAVLADVDFNGSELPGCDFGNTILTHADFTRASIVEAIGLHDRVVDGGTLSDGRRMLLTRTEPGPWRLKTSSRGDWTVEEARNWASKRADAFLAGETQAIIDHLVRLAEMRAWPDTGQEPAPSEQAAPTP